MRELAERQLPLAPNIARFLSAILHGFRGAVSENMRTDVTCA
jgi:hypothetical protein